MIAKNLISRVTSPQHTLIISKATLFYHDDGTHAHTHTFAGVSRLPASAFDGCDGANMARLLMCVGRSLRHQFMIFFFCTAI